MSLDSPSSARVVCISGGTSGIGAALVAAFLATGDRVYTFGRNPERVARLAQRHAVAAGSLVVTVADVTDAAFRAELAARIGAECGRLDCLVNNAGIIRGGGCLEEDLADWRATLETNLIAPFALTQVCAPLLRLSPAPAVINISSACAQHPFATCTSTSYSVSKAGLDMLTRRLALALGPEGIRVNAVAPGVVPSEMWGDATGLIDEIVQRRHVLQHRVVDPVDVARAVLFLASAQAQVVTGTILNVDAGYTLG
ncbi:SDR family oxidoreductase [uncultured Thiodictyon sp.]|uniref:SDR family NAD(P)-dependent oxidoreductase n=1 Tax=uncultured Thiodictyon sp. TaxID=1846217 RepID=UPI0025E9DE2A|nr:SDR family oxidoreductase [uncultured Thiodictyon sp.]